VSGPSFGGFDQKTFSNRSSHNARGHGPGIINPKTFVEDMQQFRFNSSGVNVRSGFCEKQRSEDWPGRELILEDPLK